MPLRDSLGMYYSAQLALPTQRGVEVYLLSDMVLGIDDQAELTADAQELIDVAAELLRLLGPYYSAHPRLAATFHRVLLRAVAWRLAQMQTDG